MYVCMYVRMYVCMCACTHARMYARTCPHMQTIFLVRRFSAVEQYSLYHLTYSLSENDFGGNEAFTAFLEKVKNMKNLQDLR